MTFSALDSALTRPLFASDAMRAVFSDRAGIAAMLTVEAGLAEAEARHGLAPHDLAAAIRRVEPDDLDLDALGRETAVTGVPVVPFVKAVRAKLPAGLRGTFHHGATTQDIVDTALALQMAEAFALIGVDLDAVLAGLARLARRHRTTPCVGRTYGQHAAPVTFGYVAALWRAGIADAATRLPGVRTRALTASLGGPVGTLAALGDQADAVAADFAAILGLHATPLPWHALRARVAETGAWLAILVGTLAKMAEDVVRLSSTDLGEVMEPYVPGRGASSSMPHKRNPVSATVILAAQTAAAGHVVTLLNALPAEHQRPAGRWHAEWLALPPLFGLASGALREARRLAEGLVVDERRMAENLERTAGLLFADAAVARLTPVLGAAAHDIVERASARVRETGRPLREVLAADAAVPAELHGALAAAFDIAPSVAAAAAVVDRALGDNRD